MKKILAVLLVLAMVISVAPAAFAVEESSEVGSLNNPIPLYASECPTVTVEVAAGAEVYYQLNQFSGYEVTIAGENLKVESGELRRGKYFWDEWDVADGGYGCLVENYQQLIRITNTGTAAATYTIRVSIATGTMDNPEIIDELGDYTVELSEGVEGYYFQWTATQDGKLKAVVSAESSLSMQLENTTTSQQKDFVDGMSEPYKAEDLIDISAGDVIKIMVSIIDFNDYSYPGGEAKLTLSIVAADKSEEGGSQGGEDNGSQGGDNNDPVLEEKFADYDSEYAGESFTVTPVEGYKYTVIKFSPEEAGTYTITGPEGIYLSQWAGNEQAVSVNITENETNTLEVSFEYGCIWIGVRAGEPVMLSVEKSGDIEKNETPEDIVINHKHNEGDKIISAGSFNIDDDAWEYVDVEDDVTDKAVLGDDGYYHLNSKDGPILFIDFNATYNGGGNRANFAGLMNMYLEGRGGVSCSILLEQGNLEKHNYNELVKAYLDADEDGVVALTEELMNMMKKLGEGQGWYDNDQDSSAPRGLFTAEVDKDEAWLFLCKYAVEQEDDNKDEGNKDNSSVVEPDNKDNGNVTEPDNKDNSEGKDDNANKVPETADNSALLESLMIMVIALSGVAVVLTNKKKIA